MRGSVTVAGELVRFVRAFEQGDRDTVETLIADDPGVVIIGSHGQWLRERAVIVDTLVQEARATRPSISVEGADAYEDGNVGWAALKLTWRYPTGVSVAYRWTVVLRRCDGGWKIVQSHLSAPESG